MQTDFKQLQLAVEACLCWCSLLTYLENVLSLTYKYSARLITPITALKGAKCPFLHWIKCVMIQILLCVIWWKIRETFTVLFKILSVHLLVSSFLKPYCSQCNQTFFNILLHVLHVTHFWVQICFVCIFNCPWGK